VGIPGFQLDIPSARSYLERVGKLIALTAAASLLVVTPCVALGLFTSSQAHSTCTHAVSCCCCDGHGHSPTPAPATPNSKISPDQVALLSTVGESGASTHAVSFAPLSGDPGVSVAPTPLFLTSCSFRC
jgi:hypothetical protein